MLAFLLALTLQTTPGNITKVPRDASVDLCALDSSEGDLIAGTPYELVIFIDGTHRYTVIGIWWQQQFGTVGYFAFPATPAQTPVCPSGPNAGQRPYLVRLPMLTRNTYRLEVVIFDNPTANGIIVARTVLVVT